MIWKTPIDLAIISKRAENTLSTLVGIEFIEVGPDFLKAKMPVDARTKQPLGIMHGGASCVLAETVGSVAGNFCVDLTEEYCVGLDINTNHLRQAREGFVIGTARPIHIGRTTQVWGIEIQNEQGQLVSINRLTLMVLKR
jgi:1,4-dihydroxy-2-naphthoyl-CoA hydrolase